MVFFYSSNADAAWYWPFGDDGIDYTIRIEGEDKDNKAWFEKLKLDDKTSDHPPKTIEDLDQAGIRRSNELRQALQAKGYYNAMVEYHIDKSTMPPALVFQIKQNMRYHISGVTMAWDGGEIGHIDVHTFPVRMGQSVDAEAINKQAAELLKSIGKDACLLSLDVTPVLQLNAKTFSAVLVYRVKHGPHANFGITDIYGNKKVATGAIRRLIAWKEGECYTEEKVTKTRSSLISTQLFSTVKITPGAQVDAKGEVKIEVAVSERVERTVSAGADYATDQGFGVKLGWEHRNFMGDGEKVDANAVIAQQEQSFTVVERDTGFLRDDQTLVLSNSIDRQNTEAYTSQNLDSTAAIERKISPHLNASAGLGYLLTRSNDPLEGNQDFGLVSAPLFADYDTRDNAQDARKGVFLHLAVTPYVDTFDYSTDFFKSLFIGQTYISSEMTGKPTLALRASVGTIDGASSSSLPSDLRFYAGGGGSVRGYSYQSLSPRYEGTPIGGGSLVEVSAELRVRFTEDFGGVIFLDGGNAYASQIPDFSNALYYGAGLGVRYYSPLGPLRLDVGFPLNGHDIDGSGEDATGLQVYVSLGQAF